MSQKTIQIRKSEYMIKPIGKADNLIVSQDMLNLFNKLGNKPSKKIKVRNSPKKVKTQLTKKPQLITYFYKMVNQKGFQLLGYHSKALFNGNRKID